MSNDDKLAKAIEHILENKDDVYVEFSWYPTGRREYKFIFYEEPSDGDY